MDYNFVKHLAQKGVRIFSTEQARAYGQEIGIAPKSIIGGLHRLSKKGVVDRLMKGLYCLSPEFLSGIPIHEYEIGIALAGNGCIAYLSAYEYHKLSDQISSLIYVMTPQEPGKTYSKNLYSIRGVRYRIIRVKQAQFFGVEKRWIGQIGVPVTDKERTLIDGLDKPKYCGGFREVLDAYTQAISEIDLNKIIGYAQKKNDSVCRRLGWILSRLGVNDEQLQPLMERKTVGFTRLDPSGPQKGTWNKTWFVLENL